MKLLKTILSAVIKTIGLTILGIVPDCDGAVRMGKMPQVGNRE